MSNDKVRAARETVQDIEVEVDADILAIRSATKNSAILVVPGLGNSGPDHWQSKWLDGRFPNAVRVEQDDWENPEKNAWVRRLGEYIERGVDKEIILIAHSLACPTIAHWAHECSAETRAKIFGALLVAPADVEIAPKEVTGFSPMPLKSLPFRSVVVASTDDPIVSIERAEEFAKAWRSQLKNVGPRGHINAASGLGDWPEGLQFLRELIGMGQ